MWRIPTEAAHEYNQNAKRLLTTEAASSKGWTLEAQDVRYTTQ
jgi:hypothetical protein